MSTPLIPREVLFGSDQYAAFLSSHNGVMNVWCGDWRTRSFRPVTHGSERDIRSYTWTADGRGILYLGDDRGDENWHVYAATPAGGTVRDLTPLPGVQARIIAASPGVPDRILVGLNQRDASLHDVFSLHLATGALRPVGPPRSAPRLPRASRPGLCPGPPARRPSSTAASRTRCGGRYRSGPPLPTEGSPR